jgi:hypothetical protein
VSLDDARAAMTVMTRGRTTMSRLLRLLMLLLLAAAPCAVAAGVTARCPGRTRVSMGEPWDVLRGHGSQGVGRHRVMQLGLYRICQARETYRAW